MKAADRFMLHAAGVAGIGSSDGGRKRRRCCFPVLSSHQRQLTSAVTAVVDGGRGRSVMHNVAAGAEDLSRVHAESQWASLVCKFQQRLSRRRSLRHLQSGRVLIRSPLPCAAGNLPGNPVDRREQR